MSKAIDLRDLILNISTLDIHHPDTFNNTVTLLLVHFNEYPTDIEDILNALADYFRNNSLITELLYTAVNKIKNSDNTFNNVIYYSGIEAIHTLQDRFIFGPAPMDLDDLVSNLDNVDKTPIHISKAPQISMDVIKDWLVSRLPYSQDNGYIIKMLEKLQKSFEYNPVRLAIINRAFSQLTDLASRDSNLLGWLSYSLNDTPKLRSASESANNTNSAINTIPEFYDICQNLDNIDKTTPNPDDSAMLLLAKWIHNNIQDNADTILILFDTLAERYQNNEDMLIILNTALKNMYDLGSVTDDPGLQYLLNLDPRPCIGPATSEITILTEQIEYWFKEQNLQGATQVLVSWIEVHAHILSIHPELKSKVFTKIEQSLIYVDNYHKLLPEMFSILNTAIDN